MDIIPLFKEKILLHTKKYNTIAQIDRFSLSKIYLKELKSILKEEYRINKKLEKEIRFLSKFINVELITQQLKNLTNTTRKQYDILTSIRLNFFKKINYNLFKEACRTEVEQSKFFAQLLKNLDFEEFKKYKQEFEKEKQLILDAQQKYRELLSAIGNVQKVNQKAKEFLQINQKIKKTHLYTFIQEDAQRVEKRIRYIMARPKESKLTFLLTSAYVVSPGTFELTFIFLFFRYLGKYTKTKMTNAKLKLAS